MIKSLHADTTQTAPSRSWVRIPTISVQLTNQFEGVNAARSTYGKLTWTTCTSNQVELANEKQPNRNRKRTF